MENYEQKYKEALERASKYYNANTNKGYREIFEDIFHEFKESEDERIRKELIERFNWELKGAEEQDAAGCSRQKDIAMFKRGLAWLEKQGEQKTITWSEEDEKFLNYAISLTDDTQIKNFLKSLKDRVQPQPKQEWSKEDEEKLNSTIFLLKEFREAYQENAESCINWLKSLKPCWKPTEEQLSAMDWEIRNTSEGSWQRREMESLYNFLKTL